MLLPITRVVSPVRVTTTSAGVEELLEELEDEDEELEDEEDEAELELA